MIDQSTETRILAAAKREFLSNGFAKASLRTICAQAGVTTGALYFWFESKEDLFCRIVQGTVDHLRELGIHLAISEWENISLGVDNDVQLIEFLYQHREEICLLLEKATGTRYEGFREEIFQQMQGVFLRFFQKFGAPDVDPELVRIITAMRIKSYLELINGGYEMEQIVQLSKQIGIYADGGFRRLTQYLQNPQTEKVM